MLRRLCSRPHCYRPKHHNLLSIQSQIERVASLDWNFRVSINSRAHPTVSNNRYDYILTRNSWKQCLACIAVLPDSLQELPNLYLRCEYNEQCQHENCEKCVIFSVEYLQILLIILNATSNGYPATRFFPFSNTCSGVGIMSKTLRKTPLAVFLADWIKSPISNDNPFEFRTQKTRQNNQNSFMLPENYDRVIHQLKMEWITFAFVEGKNGSVELRHSCNHVGSEKWNGFSVFVAHATKEHAQKKHSSSKQHFQIWLLVLIRTSSKQLIYLPAAPIE